MAGSFTRKRWIMAAVLVAGLPYVAPYINYNTCSGGLVAQNCTVRYSSHCCKSGTYLSATCCQNSCSEPSSCGWPSNTTCWRKTNSMCCSTKSLGSESCCNYASYSRTSISSVRGDYPRTTYGTCIGNYSTEYCLNSLSTACCTQEELYLTSATCCRSYPNITNTTGCYGYDDGGIESDGGLFIGLVTGFVVLLVYVIVVPIAVVCCRARRARRASNTNTTAFEFENRAQSRPEPAFSAVTTTSNPQARPLPDLAVTTISNQSQPQPGAYHQPPPLYGSLYPPQSDDVDQPPRYSILQLQASATPQIQPGAPPVYQP